MASSLFGVGKEMREGAVSRDRDESTERREIGRRVSKAKWWQIDGVVKMSGAVGLDDSASLWQTRQIGLLTNRARVAEVS